MLAIQHIYPTATSKVLVLVYPPVVAIVFLNTTDAGNTTDLPYCHIKGACTCVNYLSSLLLKFIFLTTTDPGSTTDLPYCHIKGGIMVNTVVLQAQALLVVRLLVYTQQCIYMSS